MDRTMFGSGDFGKIAQDVSQTLNFGDNWNFHIQPRFSDAKILGLTDEPMSSYCVLNSHLYHSNAANISSLL